MKVFWKSPILIIITNVLWKNRKVIIMTILELKNIKKSYYLGKEEFPVLKGLNLSFDKGTLFRFSGNLGREIDVNEYNWCLDRKYEGKSLSMAPNKQIKKRNQWMNIAEIPLALYFNPLTWSAISVF